MRSQWVQASGYLTIFLMPALFVVGVLIREPWLAFGVVVFVFPLARLVIGPMPAEGPPEWREPVATALDRLPAAYVPALLGCVLVAMGAAPSRLGTDVLAWVGLGFSLWMTQLFATCVAHDLIHRRDKHCALLGHRLAGFTGYPALGMEHLTHHGRPGNTDLAEVPRLTDSMWHFAGRRLQRVGAELFSHRLPLFQWGMALPGVMRMRAAMVTTLVTALAFALLAGWRGVIVYLVVSAGVAFGIQLITYIQHWGLGDDDIGDRVGFGRGWEEDCQFQAWVTLSISLHDGHHHSSRQPYYRLSLAPDSPRLPTGYVLLMFASMVPWLWQRLMRPAHAHWMAHPTDPRSAGRHLTCFGLHNT